VHEDRGDLLVNQAHRDQLVSQVLQELKEKEVHLETQELGDHLVKGEKLVNLEEWDQVALRVLEVLLERGEKEENKDLLVKQAVQDEQDLQDNKAGKDHEVLMVCQEKLDPLV